MKRIAFILLLCAALAYAHAETLVLRTGARVKGTIVFQNEEVIILRDDEGARFQYPRADVEAIYGDEVVFEEETETSQDLEAAKEEITTPKKASILLEIAGGAAFQPKEAVGGAVSADLLVGSHHIGDRHLFVGGGIGYHCIFMGTEKYNFLPILAAVRMPFTETKHAPVFGVSVGYGIALSKNYLGGIYAGGDFGYRCQLNPKSAVSLVAFVQFQQAVVPTTVVLDGNSFTTQSGRSLVNTGIKLALYF